jgi:hypothetical protein
MKSKALLAVAVAGVCWSLGAMADQPLPSAADETTPSMGTIYSYDTRSGGYKGWGPMANPQTPYSPNEAVDEAVHYSQETRDQAQQLAEVRQIRDQVWVANAPLRADYENVGATRSRAGGIGRFFHRNER